MEYGSCRYPGLLRPLSPRRGVACLLGAFALAACGMVSWTPVAWAEPLSFPQALEQMRAQNETLKAANEDIRHRAAEREAARGLGRPKVEMEVEHIRLDAPVKVGVDSIPVSLEVKNREFWEANLTASMPLYAAGRIGAAESAAEARQDEAGAQFRRAEDELVSLLAQRYYGLCLARRNREVQRLKTEAMEKHTYRAKRLMDEGIIARIEYLNANVALEETRRALDEAERTVTIAEEGLANVVVEEGEIEPVSSLFLIRDLETCETFQEYVDDGHPVLQMLNAKEDLAHQGVRAEQGANGPLVYAFGMRELVPKDLTMLDPVWAAGIGVHYTLFDGGQRKNKVEAAKALERKVGHLRTKYQRDLKSLVLKRYEEMQMALSQYDALNATLELTAENLRVRSRAFEEGVATSLEVVDATLANARAQLGRFKAAYDFDLAFFQLLEASGRSDEWKEYMDRAEPIEEHRSEAADGDLMESLVPVEVVSAETLKK